MQYTLWKQLTHGAVALGALVACGGVLNDGIESERGAATAEGFSADLADRGRADFGEDAGGLGRRLANTPARQQGSRRGVKEGAFNPAIGTLDAGSPRTVLVDRPRAKQDAGPLLDAAATPDPPREDAGASPDFAGAPCRGCVRLTVPVSGPNQLSQFAIHGPLRDFSQATVTYRLRALTLSEDFVVIPYAVNGYFDPLVQGETIALSAAHHFVDTDTWVDVSMDYSQLPPSARLDTSQVSGFGLLLGSGAGLEQRPETEVLLLVDSIRIEGVTETTGIDLTSTGSTFEIGDNNYEQQRGTSFSIFR